MAMSAASPFPGTVDYRAGEMVVKGALRRGWSPRP